MTTMSRTVVLFLVGPILALMFTVGAIPAFGASNPRASRHRRLDRDATIRTGSPGGHFARDHPGRPRHGNHPWGNL